MGIRIRAAAWGFVFCTAAFQSALAADKLPPISAADRELKEVPGEPSASAVFLIQRGKIHLRNLRFQEVATTIGVQARIKILKEEGKSRGEVSIPHDDLVRLSKFEGRTITPAGKVLKVDSKGKFKRKVSQASKRSVTSIAFPGVEVGAILEYEYELSLDDYYYVEPWYFMDELPVLQSEVKWEVPIEMRSRVWSVPTFGVQISSEQVPRQGYTEATFRAQNVPSVPDEVYGMPFPDLAARMMVVPMAYRDEDMEIPILDSWASVCGRYEKSYERARKQSTQVAAKAASLTAGKSADEIPAVLHVFVRDQIKTVDLTGPWIYDDVTLDKILAKGEGTHAEKALLLQGLLQAANQKAQLVWAARRTRGKILADLPNPLRFDRVLVRVGRGTSLHTFLDPVDPSLAIGVLSPAYEGTLAVVHDPKTPETITLPMRSFISNQRQAKLDLTVDADGRTAGKGQLVLKGNYAWEESFPSREPAETTKAWSKWAEDALPGYRISDIKVVDQPDESALRVEWAMAATEESVLGDEVTLHPARPIGPFRQPFTVSSSERRSSVLLDHHGVEEVEVTVAWPKGWSPSPPPPSWSMEAGIASYRIDTKADPGGTTLSYKRRLEIRKREPADRTEFGALRNLFAEAEKRDAQTVVLTRR